MGFEYRLKECVTGVLSVQGIGEIFSRARGALPGFNEVKSYNNAFLEPKELPELQSVDGLSIAGIRTEGYLPLNDNSIDTLAEVLAKGETSVGKNGVLIAGCGFEEASSKQSKRCFDTVSLRIDKGKRYFVYNANGSNVDKDPAYRREFLHRMISVLHLPLRITDKEGGVFRLEHTAGGELRILKGFFEDNPAAFWCEMAGERTESLVARMREFLQTFASPKRFEFTWRVFGSEGSDPITAIELYNRVYKERFPATRYSVHLEFDVEGPVSVLPALRAMCGEKDEIYTKLFSFEFADGAYGEFSVITTREGHKVELDLSDPEALAAVEEKLQLEFVPTK